MFHLEKRNVVVVVIAIITDVVIIVQQAQRLEFERERKGSTASPETRIQKEEKEVHSRLTDSNLRGRGRGTQPTQRLKFERERKRSTASSQTRI
jgi:NADH:ubiquinone oxidoreductase subunit F (NADH-binding)